MIISGIEVIKPALSHILFKSIDRNAYVSPTIKT